ncbi:RNA ligase/cyclic nucleotide phosphodiesterase [Legionella birminghamensis]|uniref:RNA 2',3'-cyclic phosphodiesterase n=1 Tax=Legionella birminghamensis TaxID=28083 RepID=A0A378IBS0_9GAMM|nr:RNA 2',3'-cyclic phosphodiesterase [Legionella birminghamensis]KTC74491.1 RNA ligase/cyclic nucleotide phosphodiesterase [Legionella birminghamensis]STX32619.1 RNA ligase/cyclic nucleotide phosphodiesterase [Legionella birminghamensis]
MDSFRAFFGIKIEHQAQEKLAQLIEELKHCSPHSSIRWTAKENLHITLQFVQQMQIRDTFALAQTLALELHSEPFPVEFGDFIYFPKRSQPRVISLKVEPNDKLAALAEIIGKVLAQFGYPVETRSYNAHATLGRVRNSGWNIEFFEQFNLQPMAAMEVKEIILFESVSGKEGLRYVPLMKWPIEGQQF